MRIELVTHPVLADVLAGIRDRDTPGEQFTALVGRATTMLLVPATAHLPVSPTQVETPLATADAQILTRQPLIVPVLRAALTMLDSARAFLPRAPVGFVGLRRDEETATATWYLDSLPAALSGRHVLILEPMVATGGTLTQVITELRARGAGPITILSLICCTQGLEVLERLHDEDLTVVTAAVDQALTPNRFISPGLGDAGDRSFGWP